MTSASYTFGWVFTFILCFELFHGAWGDCPSPPNIPNTSPVAETSGTTGQEIVCTCDHNTGYYESPGKSTTITCQADGTWTVIEEFCIRACGVPPRRSDALPTDDALNQKIFVPGATVTYDCRPGYIKIPGSKRLITCLEDYTWSTPDPFCLRRSCGNPGEIENGNMQAEDFLFGSRVTYTCNTGYSMISKLNYRECLEDGTWSNAPPQCEASTCEKIQELQEEARKCTSTPDEWIKYLQVQYLYLQIENLKLDIEIKKKKLSAESTTWQRKTYY